MFVEGKGKYNHKTLHEKCRALKDFEKGISNKDVAAKSTWVKLMNSLEKGSNITHATKIENR